MNKCSFWKGGHDWVIIAKGTVEETWCRTYQGMEVRGTDHKRYRPTVIKRCIKCQELRAYDGWEDTPVSIEFAVKKIVQLGGIIEDNILAVIDLDKGK